MILKKEDRIVVSETFFLDEFIDPITYEKEGQNSINKIDKRLITIAQYIRDNIKASVTINSWSSGGQYQESGLRQDNTTTGAKLSQHKAGKAIDIKVKGVSSKDILEFVKQHAKQLYDLGLRRIEDISITPTWFHLDLKEHGLGRVIRIIDKVKETGKIVA